MKIEKSNAKSRRVIAAIAIVAVIAIILTVAVTIIIGNQRELTQAASDTCKLNAKTLTVHQEAQSEAEQAAKLTVDDVANGSTLETLKDAMKLADAVDDAPTCPAKGNADDFTKATNDIKDYADNLRNITNELDSAVKAVLASQEMKLETAKSPNPPSTASSDRSRPVEAERPGRWPDRLCQSLAAPSPPTTQPIS